MKVIFDSNIYISWIREKKYPDLILNPYTQKFLSGIVLMELWAGAKTKQANRIISKLQQPYIKGNRIISLTKNDYIKAGQIISDLPVNYKSTIRLASFLNDIFISLNVISIGATLYTENQKDFTLINKYVKRLKVKYI